jgi:integrase
MPRTKHKLTVAKAKSEKLKPGLYGDGGGLYLQVSNRRTKSWVFRYMIAGRARKMGLGDFDRVTLAEARDAAHDAHLLARDGRDPIGERKARKAAIKAEGEALTFKEAAEQLIAMKSTGWKHAGKSAAQWRASLETYAYPVFGDRPVASIDKPMVLKVLTPIWETKTVTATRVRNRIENVLDWAKACGHRQGDNPAAWDGNLKYLLAEPEKVTPVKHFAAMPYKDLPAFMERLRAKEGISARALEYTILTVARTANTIGGKWSEIDKTEKLWTVPGPQLKGEKGKKRSDHVVPLADRSFALLKDLPREADFIFPGGVAKKGLSNAAMSELLKGMGYTGKMATVHGFRSTFKDWAAEQTNYPNELTEMAMAHTINNKVEAAYRRGDMREKRRRLMEDWAAYCDGVAANSDNVVAIGGRK